VKFEHENQTTLVSQESKVLRNQISNLKNEKKKSEEDLIETRKKLERVETTLETSGKDVKLHSERVGKT
jgi:hypothetical protein